MIPMIMTGENLTIILNSKQHTIPRSAANFDEVLQAVRDEDIEQLEILVAPAKAIVSYMTGNVSVEDGVVLYKGAPLEGLVVDRIIQFMNDGLPYQPLVSFTDRLMANPSFRAVTELYGFLESKGIPIDEDGFFYAYKAVSDDWTDKHTGTISNHIGAVVTMERNLVDDNREAGCSKGLHAGNLDYVSSFGSYGDKILIVKIDPADVVSVPTEDCRKLRCCKYEVISEYVGELSAPLYQSSSSGSVPKEWDRAMRDTYTEDNEERCYLCDELLDSCECYCPDCGDYFEECTCGSFDETETCQDCLEDVDHCKCCLETADDLKLDLEEKEEEDKGSPPPLPETTFWF